LSQDPIRLAGGSNLYSYVYNTNTSIDPLGLESFSLGNNNIERPQLPAYDGKTTQGTLYYTDSNGQVQSENFSSGGKSQYPNYANANHVEGKSALFMRDEKIQEGIVFHNNTDGTCGFCVSMTPTLLPEGASLTIVPPEDAEATKRGAVDETITIIGNENEPKECNK
jgi:uncharacterized protein RhaS with RHS repeats